jgi:hypothetical protein
MRRRPAALEFVSLTRNKKRSTELVFAAFLKSTNKR